VTAAESPRPVPVSERGSAPRWRRYVAVGDSFTEGLWDPTPGDEDRCRGWADRLAEILDARRGGDLEYANLAVRGRLLRPILTEQVPAALRSEPDLVSLIGGGNDVLRPGSDVDLLAERLESTVARIRETGADVLLSTGVDTVESPVIKLTRSKTAIFNSHVWSIARRHDAYVLDLWGMRFLKDWRMWSEDRIHLTPEGHRRMAQGALEALGLVPDDPEWDTPLAAPDAEAWAARVRQNAQWVREHAYPWVQRRVRHQSSGDTRVAKQPVPGSVRRPTD